MRPLVVFHGSHQYDVGYRFAPEPPARMNTECETETKDTSLLLRTEQLDLFCWEM